MEKNLAIEGLEKERDFYFGKLRDIEVLAQELESADIAGPEFSQKILGVLYATEVITLFLFFIPICFLVYCTIKFSPRVPLQNNCHVFRCQLRSEDFVFGFVGYL